jgi:hypothetical protein
MNRPSFISHRLDEIAVRSARGTDIIKREPRDVPRRLRAILLAIDGRQPARAYINTLVGFGDVEAALSELATLGLIEFRSNAKRSRVTPPADPADSRFDDSSFSSFAPLEDLMRAPDRLFETLSQATTPGSFDDLVRVAKLDNPAYVERPPPPPPAPVRPKDLDRQVESLFALLDAARGERKTLKERVARLRKYRERAQYLASENRRLISGVYTLSGTCALLVGLMLLLAMRR